MLARVTPIKRIYEAILILYELHCQGHPFTLLIGGSQDDMQERRYIWAMQELVMQLELEKDIIFLGHIQEPVQFYREIDIFLSNSFWEGQQRALLEAMASGCYCLSHCWGGVEEILPSSQIFKTNREAIEKLIAYARLPESGRHAKQVDMRNIIKKRFGQQRMISEVLTLFDEIDL